MFEAPQWSLCLTPDRSVTGNSVTGTYLCTNRVISNDADRCKSFLHFITCIEHTSSWAQELRLFWSLCSSGFTLSCSALAFINLVLPTSHLFDH